MSEKATTFEPISELMNIHHRLSGAADRVYRVISHLHFAEHPAPQLPDPNRRIAELEAYISGLSRDLQASEREVGAQQLRAERQMEQAESLRRRNADLEAELKTMRIEIHKANVIIGCQATQLNEATTTKLDLAKDIEQRELQKMADRLTEKDKEIARQRRFVEELADAGREAQDKLKTVISGKNAEIASLKAQLDGATKAISSPPELRAEAASHMEQLFDIFVRHLRSHDEGGTMSRTAKAER